EIALCKIVGLLYEMFEVFAGINKVTYRGERDYLINIFFYNRSINNVYWGMALIGIALAFAFTIAAVVRKVFDSSGKVQESLGQTITHFLRSVFLILGLSAIMVVVLNSTNVLMQQVNYMFSNAENLDIPETIVYTDEQYAAMGRALNTIGNYSLVPSYSSRYNLNTCYNEIRQDLLYLQQQGVFRYHYSETNENGKPVKSWQSVLQSIANAADLRYDIPLDAYNDGVSRAILDAMDTLGKDASLRPLREFSRVTPSGTRVPMDRFVFLMGTMRAAKNSRYNENPTLDDAIRGPYYVGEKNIYDLDDVDEDFRIGFDTDYIIVYVACVALIWDLAVIILNCIARIFNMLFLYLIAPPIFAAQPLDNGGKTKQWMTAFIVQALSVFGTVIAMQLLLIVLPIIASADLVLFENGMLNIMAKLVMVYGMFEVAKKATALLTGILADSAGLQSIQAGDMSSSASSLVGGAASLATGVAGRAAGLGMTVAGKVGGFAAAPVGNLLSRGWNATLGRLGGWWSNLGKGDVAGQRAMASARERLASEQAYEKLTSSPPSDSDSESDTSELPPRNDPPMPEQRQSGGKNGPMSEQALPKDPAPAQGNSPSAFSRPRAAGESREAPAPSGRPTLDDRPVMSPPPRRMTLSGKREEKDLPHSMK
ncbi:MAG: hypothetical protein IJQ98_05450, partial [Oscillospiraceae bacterium]|nr:hypothetical protein [Oscillospiraceae bacterium]